jgi:acetoin utilization deacetylase AcuC-like enzyme
MKSMGFCIFNNVALAARYAQRVHDLGRILIVDWDVHHGNGTQDIFYEDESVGFFSIHRFPFYPGSGDRSETGKGKGLGSTFNEPVKYGTTRSQFLQKFRDGLQKAAEAMRPELIIISAGFDAHKNDPIGDIGLESSDFATMTQDLIHVADHFCEGRVLSCLEGGYHLEALGESVRLHFEELCRASTPKEG